MRRMVVLSACIIGVSCLFSGTTDAQDPGQSATSPPRIQGPPGGPLALQPEPSLGATAGPLKFKMYAMLGQQKSAAPQTLDPDIAPVEAVLKTLPFNDYEKITVDERETPDAVETAFPINPVYTLVVQPNGTDSQGASKVDIHVDLMQDNTLVKALTAQAAVKPGDALVLRGMPLPPGELVLVLQRDAGDQQSQDGQSQENEQDQQKKEDQKKDQEDKKQDAQKDEKNEDRQQEEKKEQAEQQEQDNRQQPSPNDAKKDDSEKKDTKNLESLLQSLEEVDRKEQSEVRNKRDSIDFNGDWW